MTWLSDECLAELKTKGYYAVPKEQIEVLYVENMIDLYATQTFDGKIKDDYARHLEHSMAKHMANELLKKGFIKPVVVKEDDPARNFYIRTRAELTVVKPK